MNNWWVEVTPNGSPFTPYKKPIQSDVKPVGNYLGAFHCAKCAEDCVSFGKTEQQAWDFNHGTADAKFCVYLAVG